MLRQPKQKKNDYPFYKMLEDFLQYYTLLLEAQMSTNEDSLYQCSLNFFSDFTILTPSQQNL